MDAAVIQNAGFERDPQLTRRSEFAVGMDMIMPKAARCGARRSASRPAGSRIGVRHSPSAIPLANKPQRPVELLDSCLKNLGT
jgi:hypothetical protein